MAGVDYAAAWTEFAAWIAAEPNRGRQASLVKMAELAERHKLDEDELHRVLRVYGPQIVELLADRMARSGPDHDHTAPEATAGGFDHVPASNADRDRPSIAA